MVPRGNSWCGDNSVLVHLVLGPNFDFFDRFLWTRVFGKSSVIFFLESSMFVASTSIFYLLQVVDYVGPKIINQVYGVDSWTPSKERQFDEVCENIIYTMEKMESVWSLCREARARKPIIHFLATLFFFFSLAAIGNRIHNLFLAYMVTTLTMMLPGLHKKGKLQQWSASITLKFAEIVKGKEYLKKAE